MKKKLLPLLTVGLLVGSMAAQALPMVFIAALSGANEVPSIVSTGSGTATITIDDLLNTMRVEASFSDLMGNTIAAHIHCCTAPGTNVGVATTLPSFSGFPLGVTSGTYDTLFDMTDATSYSAAFLTANGGTTAQAFSALITGFTAGNAYFNIHTTAFPAGELRDQLHPETVVPAIPVPGTLALFGLGFAGLCMSRRRKAS
ncbi:MAG: CHRD domain-containing protein [Halioglobus sp.]